MSKEIKEKLVLFKNKTNKQWVLGIIKQEVNNGWLVNIIRYDDDCAESIDMNHMVDVVWESVLLCREWEIVG